MRKIKSTVLITGLMCILVLSGLNFALAQRNSNIPAAYLQIGVGARALAMGGAFVAVADDATAVYWNPAGITQLSRFEVAAMYTKMDLYQEHNYLTLATPRVALSMIRFGVDGIPEYGPDGPYDEPTGMLKDAEAAYIATFALPLGKIFSLGINYKYLTQELAGESASGQGIDAGALLRLGWKWLGINVGLLAQDLPLLAEEGTKIEWDYGHTEVIPTNIKLGVALRLINMLIALDVDNIGKDDEVVLHLGTEIFLGNVALRVAGFSEPIPRERLEEEIEHIEEFSESFLEKFTLSAGGGVKITKNIRFDYAFVDTELGAKHLVSLGLSF